MYDNCGLYAERLVGFLESREGILVNRFTMKNRLEEHIKLGANELYLLEDSEYCRELISKYKLNAYLLTDDISMEKSGVISCIYRYRSATEILSILSQKLDNKVETDGNQVEMFAFISPFNELYLDNIVIELSLNATKKTLIVDFRNISMWDTIDDNERMTLSDVVFLAKEGCERLSSEIDKSIYHFNNIDVIYGMSSSRDVFEVTSKDIDSIATVATLKEYKKVIMILPAWIIDTVELSSLGKNILFFVCGNKKEQMLVDRMAARLNVDIMKYEFGECKNEYTLEPDDYMSRRSSSGKVNKLIEELENGGII